MSTNATPGMSNEQTPDLAPLAADRERREPDATPASVIALVLHEMREWRKEVERERAEAAKERTSERRWRIFFQGLFFGFPIVISVLYFLFFVGGPTLSLGPLSEVIGLVKISGQITSSGLASAEKVVPALERAFSNPRVRAVVLSIDSPGGLPAEAERIYNALEDFKKRYQKPAVAVIGSMGASAGYMIAMHADSVHAASYSVVGSIGAVMTGWDFHKGMDRLGVAQRVYASGSLKAMLNPFTPGTAAADAKALALVKGLAAEFVAQLHRLRGDRLKQGVDFGTGEVWGGYEAKGLGLIDSVGTLEQVVAQKWPGMRLYDFGPRRGGVGSVFSEGLLDIEGLVDRAVYSLYPQVR